VLELWDQVPAAERLVGIALPSLLAWAAELAGMSVPREDVVDARKLVGVLPPGQALELETVAARLGVSVEAARTCLRRSRANWSSRSPTARSGPLRSASRRRAGSIRPSSCSRASRCVNRRRSVLSRWTRCGAATSACSPPATTRRRRSQPTDDFHTALTADCGNEQLIAALRPIRRALRYERVYMREPALVERSVGQHAAIIAALERRDHAEAAQRLRENLAGGLPDLREALES
jgi:hypothetical protein